MSNAPATPPARVLLVIASGELGGGTTHVLQLLEGLDRRRWQPSLVCDPAGPLSSKARDLGIEVFTLPFMRGRLRPGLLLRLRRFVARGNFALVHVHGTRAGLAVRLALAGREEPLVYTEHGLATDARRSRIEGRLGRGAEALIVGAAQRVISLSDYSKKKLLSFSAVKEGAIEVIPNAVLLPGESGARERLRCELGIAPETVVAGTVARMIDKKAPLDLIETARILSADRPMTRWLIVGDGPLRAAAVRAAAAAKVPVTFLGTREDAREVVSAFDIFCLASRREGVPIAALEAMACSIPVVATAVGGVPSIITHGENGLLVPSGRPEKLAGAIRALVDDARLRRTMGERGRDRILSCHTVDRLIAAVSSIYERLIDGTRSAPAGGEKAAGRPIAGREP